MKTNIYGGLPTHESFAIPVKSGCDYIRDKHGRPITRTRGQAQYLANRMAKQCLHKGMWTGVVADCADYYRISIGAK